MTFMSIEVVPILVTLVLGLAAGGLVGWFVCRPAQARLSADVEKCRAELETARLELERVRAELGKERAVHAERLKAYQSAEATLRDAFQALSADALRTNNEAFL